MAGIDSSIYSQYQPIDFMGSAQKGLSMRDMLDKRDIQKKQLAEDQAIKDAYKAGIVKNDDGTTSFNSELTGNQILGINPQKGLEFKAQQKAQSAADQKAKYEKVKQSAEFFGSIKDKIGDQQSYEYAMNQARQMGADTSMMPPQWGPDAKQKIDFFHGQALSVQQQMDQLYKDRDFGLREKELQSRAADRIEARSDRRFQFGQKMDEKRTAITEKRNAQMYEIEDRRQNINANLAQLKTMVKNDGTYEMFGSHNQDMDRLIEQTATDMAKLMDPSSVARPSEVEQIKKSLIQPGLSNRNSTAVDILNNFENEVERRASSAYKIRGLEAPRGRGQAKDSEAQAPKTFKTSEIEW